MARKNSTAKVEFDLDDITEIVSLITAKKYLQAALMFIKLLRDRKATLGLKLPE